MIYSSLLLGAPTQRKAYIDRAANPLMFAEGDIVEIEFDLQKEL
jgi:hypothetical protein